MDNKTADLIAKLAQLNPNRPIDRAEKERIHQELKDIKDLIDALVAKITTNNASRFKIKKDPISSIILGYNTTLLDRINKALNPPQPSAGQNPRSLAAHGALGPAPEIKKMREGKLSQQERGELIRNLQYYQKECDRIQTRLREIQPQNGILPVINFKQQPAQDWLEKLKKCKELFETVAEHTETKDDELRQEIMLFSNSLVMLLREFLPHRSLPLDLIHIYILLRTGQSATAWLATAETHLRDYQDAADPEERARTEKNIRDMHRHIEALIANIETSIPEPQRDRVILFDWGVTANGALHSLREARQILQQSGLFTQPAPQAPLAPPPAPIRAASPVEQKIISQQPPVGSAGAVDILSRDLKDSKQDEQLSSPKRKPSDAQTLARVGVIASPPKKEEKRSPWECPLVWPKHHVMEDPYILRVVIGGKEHILTGEKEHFKDYLRKNNGEFPKGNKIEVNAQGEPVRGFYPNTAAREMIAVMIQQGMIDAPPQPQKSP